MSAPRHNSRRGFAEGTSPCPPSHSSNEHVLLQLEKDALPYAIRDKHEDVVRLLQHLPPPVVAESSTLGYWYALALLSTSRLNEGSRIVDLMEQSHPRPDNLTTGRILIVRAVESVFGGASDRALEFVRTASSILPDTAFQENFRAWATIQVLAIHFGYFSMGEEASERLREIRLHLPADQHWWYSFVVPNQADWLLKTGRMDEAEEFLREYLPTSPADAEPVLHMRLAVIALEKLDLEGAEAHLGALPSPLPHKYWTLEAELTKVNYMRAKGDTESAITALYSIIRNRTALGSDVEIYRPQLVLADIWIEQRQLDLAIIWLDLASRSIDEWPRTFGHPMPEMTRIKLAIASESWHDAESRLLPLCETGQIRKHDGMLVSFYSHLAFVLAQQGKDTEAVATAKQAIEAGTQGAFLTSFLVNNVDIREFIDTEPHIVVHRERQKSLSEETLSAREIEVIQLLSSGITNQQIADTLYISRNTVKIHLQNIYRKLGATNRREAVEVSRWMGLLQQ